MKIKNRKILTELEDQLSDMMDSVATEMVRLDADDPDEEPVFNRYETFYEKLNGLHSDVLTMRRMI